MPLTARHARHGAWAALLAAGILTAAIAPSGVAATVDPSTLQPPPPPGSVCRPDGRFVICHTQLHLSSDSAPVFDLPCGTVYETSHDDRYGIRWYQEGLLTRRRVNATLSGFWTLSGSGGEPHVAISAHWNWWIDYPIPGDEDSGVLTAHGDSFTARAPGGGVIAQVAGLDAPDGTHHGVLRFIDDADTAAALCQAMS